MVIETQNGVHRKWAKEIRNFCESGDMTVARVWLVSPQSLDREMEITRKYSKIVHRVVMVTL